MATDPEHNEQAQRRGRGVPRREQEIEELTLCCPCVEYLFVVKIMLLGEQKRRTDTVLTMCGMFVYAFELSSIIIDRSIEY